MKDAMISWFIDTLGGKSGRRIYRILISMVPILELRGGLLAAGPAILDIPQWQAIPDLYCRKSDPDSVHPAFDHEDL